MRKAAIFIIMIIGIMLMGFSCIKSPRIQITDQLVVSYKDDQFYISRDGQTGKIYKNDELWYTRTNVFKTLFANRKSVYVSTDNEVLAIGFDGKVMTTYPVKHVSDIRGDDQYVFFRQSQSEGVGVYVLSVKDDQLHDLSDDAFIQVNDEGNHLRSFDEILIMEYGDWLLFLKRLSEYSGRSEVNFYNRSKNMDHPVFEEGDLKFSSGGILLNYDEERITYLYTQIWNEKYLLTIDEQGELICIALYDEVSDVKRYIGNGVFVTSEGHLQNNYHKFDAIYRVDIADRSLKTIYRTDKREEILDYRDPYTIEYYGYDKKIVRKNILTGDIETLLQAPWMKMYTYYFEVEGDNLYIYDSDFKLVKRIVCY